jgi:hypothetical protein
MKQPKPRPTPKLRADGRCVECGKEFSIAPRPGLNPVTYIDPFCSAVCARRYFGTETPTSKTR